MIHGENYYLQYLIHLCYTMNMKNITFTLVTLIIVGLCIAIGYLALTWMRSPADYINQSSDQVGDLLDIQSPDTAGTVPAEIPAATTISESDPVVTSEPDNKNTSLIVSLEKAKKAGTILKIGSKGDAVKAVQEFLNLYLKQTRRADGDFGKTTETDYKKFQSTEKLPTTGQVGSQGFSRMIEWLNKN